MFDLVDQINATHREIGNAPLNGSEGRSLLLRRAYDASIEDVWSACTDATRLARWFGRVDGDLHVGGSFQVHDNASGDILSCEEPHLLRLTWMLGPGMATEVEVRLAPRESGTVLVLEHTTPADVLDELVRTYGPGGTIGVGTGWDITLLGLQLHLDGTAIDLTTWEDSADVAAFAVRSCESWGDVVKEAWSVDNATIEQAIAFAVSNFVPHTPSTPDVNAS